jgi:hypothetical protein
VFVRAETVTPKGAMHVFQLPTDMFSHMQGFGLRSDTAHAAATLPCRTSTVIHHRHDL